MRKIAFLMVMFFVLFMLTSCYVNNDEKDSPTDESESQHNESIADTIKKDFISQMAIEESIDTWEIVILWNKEDVYAFRPYGMSDLCVMYEVEIAGVEMSCFSSDPIYIWRNSCIYDFSDAYKKGIISYYDLFHIKDGCYLWDYQTIVEQMYANRFSQEEIKISQFYGAYGDSIEPALALMMSDVSVAVEWQDEVAGMEINYTDGREILVFYNYNFYTLQEAYDNQILVEEDIYHIKWRHNSQNRYCKLGEIYAFLKDLDLADIVEIQYVNYLGSICPGVLQNVISTVNKDDIQEIVTYLSNVNLQASKSEYYETPGDASPYYSIITNDNVYRIYLADWYEIDGVFYLADFELPKIQNGQDAYNILEHVSSLSIYYNSREIGEFTDLDTLVFQEYIPIMLDQTDDLYIQTSAGKIRIIDQKHFEYNYKYYEIIGSHDLQDAILLSALSSVIVPVYEVSVYYNNELLAIILYNSGQTVTENEIKSVLGLDMYSWQLYDETMVNQIDNLTIASDLEIYLKESEIDEHGAK